MNATVGKLIRTAQTSFPFLLDLKFTVMRQYRTWRNIAFESDFDALALFPDARDALFLDVGANRGQSTDAILLRTRNGRIEQFEPNPRLCEKLRGLYADNPRISTHAYGLGDVAAKQVLYVPFYKKWMFDGLASFDAAKARDWLKGRMFFYRDRHLTLRETPCGIRRLDELDLKPFFIKLDIQGYEFRALKGGEQTLKACLPVLLIESPPEPEIVEYLLGFGYRMYAFMDGRFFPERMGSLNTFFMTPDKSDLVRRHIGGS